MGKPQTLGVHVIAINIIVTFCALGMACKQLLSTSTEEDDTALFCWVAAYGLYLLVKRSIGQDLLAIGIWFPYTIILLIFRVINFDYRKVFELPINLYIIFALTIIGYVCSKIMDERTAVHTRPPFSLEFHNLACNANKPIVSKSMTNTSTSNETPASIAQPASQILNSNTTTNSIEIKPDATLPLPTIDKSDQPPSVGWLDERNNAPQWANSKQTMNSVCQPALSLNLNASASEFMPSAPELTTSDSADDQAKTFDFPSHAPSK